MSLRSILGFVAFVVAAVWAPGGEAGAASAIDARLEVRDPVIVGGLAVYLVVDKAASGVAGAVAGTKLLAEALADGTLTITELDAGGSVPTLLAHNKGAVAVLAMAGDVVHGGKQDRAFAQDTLIPPSTEPQPIAVNCVEHSRWSAGRASGFSYAGKSEVSLSKTLATERDQGATWAKVAELNAAKGQAPSTGTYRASLEASDAEVKRVVAELAAVADARAVGVVVAVKGDLEAAEIYDDAGIFGRARSALLASVALDAIGRGVVTGADSPAPDAAAAAKWVLDARAAEESVVAAQPASAYINLENDATTTYELRDAEGKKLKQSIYKK